MDIQAIKELMQLFEHSRATRLTIHDENFLFEVEEAVVYAQPAAMAAPIAATAVAAPSEPAAAAVPADDPQLVRAPLVGTLYLSPAPDAETFVSVGKRVEKGETICIIEAMKIMNEIPAPYSGTVREIIAKNGAVVGYDDVLMRLEKD